MESRTRAKSVLIRFTDAEFDALAKKIEMSGIKNREAYLRKMALHGYIVRFDTTESKELLRLIANATGNINQVSRRCNESRSVHENDVLQLAKQVELLKENARKAINIYKQAKQFLDS